MRFTGKRVKNKPGSRKRARWINKVDLSAKSARNMKNGEVSSRRRGCPCGKMRFLNSEKGGVGEEKRSTWLKALQRHHPFFISIKQE